MPVTGPLGLEASSVANGGSGTPLAVLAFAGTVAHGSLPGMTDPTNTGDSEASADTGGSNGSADSGALNGSAVRDLAEIPAVEEITRSAVMLMRAAAEKLGLSAAEPDDSPHRDLDEARRLITALAGLVNASVEFLGPHAGPVRDGLKSLQLAFRESSAAPDDPGHGPGEKYTGPVW